MKFKNQALTFHSDAVPPDTLVVTKFVGDEQLSGLFRFELELLCQDSELDLEAVLYAPARLGIQIAMPMASGGVATTQREIAGVLAEMEQQEEGQGWVKYRAVLVPKLWQLTRTHRSRIFMEKAVDELVKAVLETDGMDPKVDFNLQLSRQGKAQSSPDRAIYPKRDYVVQYEESDWDFVTRWLEHEGIYFYFVNSDDDDDDDGGKEKAVFADTSSAYAKSPFDSVFPYRPATAGKDAVSDKFRPEHIYSFRCRQTRLPTQVTVNDYNWRTPSAELKYSAKVRKDGTGQQTEYNDHFKTEAQGTALATVRGEELSCRARWFHGESSCRTFRPGATFTLEEHFRDDWNAAYLLVSVHHEAEQMISLESSTITGVKYENAFEAIPANQNFRPERTTAWPSIKGVMNAKVDAEGDGEYAEMDELGRYKLTIPFDQHAADAKPGKASRWVRMAQPYAGQNAGMHFPLRKGTEVLITHIDGDPDRPIIAGAVPNPENESPSTAANRTTNTIRTASGNTMRIDDNAAAPGFFTFDAASCRVSDRRFRLPGKDPQPSAGGQPQPGNGGATPQSAASPRRLPMPPNATPGPGSGMAEQDINSTLWSDLGVAEAWKTFFTGDAFKAIVDSGRYRLSRDNTSIEPGLSLTDANLLRWAGLKDTQLNENNIVSLLNYLLSKHDLADKLGEAGVQGTELHHKIGDLVVNRAQNFEGTASGSSVEVSIGDSVTFSLGDSYEYADGSNSISIGTGGYTREETLGDGTTESFNHGNSVERSYTYAGKASYEHEFSGSASFSLTVSVQTENEVKLGVFNSNSMCLGAVAETEILLGGKIATEINLAGILEVELGVKSEFKTSNFETILSSDEVTVRDFDAALSSSKAYLEHKKAALTTTEAALSTKKAALTATLAAIDRNDATLASKVATLTKQITALSKTETALSADQTALSTRTTALSDARTAILHSLQ